MEPTGRFLPKGLFGRWMDERRGIWQMSLQNPQELSHFAMDRGLSFWRDHIEYLWSLRLLQADLVISKIRLRNRGLIFLRKDDDGRYLYSDERLPIRRRRGWANALENISELQDGVELLFHPFRYYVLYQLERLIELRIAPMQMLRSKSYASLLDYEVERFTRLTSKSDFIERVARWNSLTALTIATEPFAYQAIFHKLKWSLEIELEEQEARIERHWEELTKIYESIGLERLEAVRKELCIARDMLDHNKTLHTLLRLSNAPTRERLKGAIGGAMLLLVMAETLRRGEEKTFGVQLPEEDELGFGWWPIDAKKNLYGSNRILDGDRAVAGQFMRHLSLDYGIRLRWYVEGDTEYYFIKEILDDLGVAHVQLINLRGQFVEKGGKGLQFRESLRGDIAARVFSMISVDGDNQTYLKAVRGAAQEDEMCGMFFVSQPDFELHNFSVSELEEVLWSLLAPEAQTSDARKTLHNAVLGATSAKQLLSLAQTALSDLINIGKGQSWGRALFEYATDHPDMKSGERRPVLESITIAVRANSYNYLTTKNKKRTDPETGRTVPRLP